nr:MAG TPA: hypothetical protein [Caudoviricetes sp.]
METEGPIVAKLTRQTLKQIKALSLPDFRAWLIEYSNQVYNMGIDDCKTALHEEFGFGPERLKRMTEHITGVEGRKQ